MNPQDPLAALHPLRQPEAVGWWPPAPGWWVLLILFIVALGALVFYFYKRWADNAYRRIGAQQLRGLYVQYEQHHDTTTLLTQVNALLKSVALVAYPREDVAASHSADWVAFLNLRDSGAQFPQDFDQALYRASESVDVEKLESCAMHWIRHHQVQR